MGSSGRQSAYASLCVCEREFGFNPLPTHTFTNTATHTAQQPPEVPAVTSDGRPVSVWTSHHPFHYCPSHKGDETLKTHPLPILAPTRPCTHLFSTQEILLKYS